MEVGRREVVAVLAVGRREVVAVGKSPVQSRSSSPLVCVCRRIHPNAGCAGTQANRHDDAGLTAWLPFGEIPGVCLK